MIASESCADMDACSWCNFFLGGGALYYMQAVRLVSPFNLFGYITPGLGNPDYLMTYCISLQECTLHVDIFRGRFMPIPRVGEVILGYNLGKGKTSGGWRIGSLLYLSISCEDDTIVIILEYRYKLW